MSGARQSGDHEPYRAAAHGQFQQPYGLRQRQPERLSNQVSNNHHLQEWTPTDIDGRCLPLEPLKEELEFLIGSFCNLVIRRFRRDRARRT